MKTCPRCNTGEVYGDRAHCEGCIREAVGRPAKWGGDHPKPKRTRTPPANMAAQVAAHRAEEARLKWDYKGGSE